MQCQWQTSMQCFDPVAITIGSFQIHWYALCFLLAWWVGTRVALWYDQRQEVPSLSEIEWESLSWWLLLSVIIGARIGFAVFYMPGYFLEHPITLFFPYNFETHTWSAISGMSFHGGILGAALGLYWWTRHHGRDFFRITDRLVIAIPLVSLIGRVGNFLNQELPGRVTESPLGMYFSLETVLRHPVTLYSALIEGVLLFGWMWFWAKRLKGRGQLTVLYLFSYAPVRFVLEYWREPDPGVSLFLGAFTRGQVLSLVLLFGTLMYWMAYGDIVDKKKK